MKRNRPNIKKTIGKKLDALSIEDQKRFKSSDNLKNKKPVNDRDKMRIYGTTKAIYSDEKIIKAKSPKERALLIEKYRAMGKNIKIVNDPTYQLKDYGEYIKKEDVDYDAIIYIPSFNRYDSVKRLLEQIYTQETKYTFKVILMNDGSNDIRYDNLSNLYDNLKYIKNEKNGGVKCYWKTTNKILDQVKKYKTHCIIEIDDDFILCNNFINKSLDKYFELKYEDNCNMLCKYHLGILDHSNITNDFFDPIINFQSADGGTLFDPFFFELINYTIDDMTKFAGNAGSGVWNYINEKIREFGVKCYVLRESLAYHNGNKNSKMHPSVRLSRKYNTINFNRNE